MPDTKMCHGPCGLELPFSAFYQNRTTKDGYGYKCKKCLKEYGKKYYLKCGERLKKYQKEYCRNNREKITRYQQEYYTSFMGRLRRIFHNLNHRCTDPENKDYPRYGGRGIQNKFKSPDDFRDHIINDLGITTFDQIKGLQVHRTNNDSHYMQGNIEFLTPEEHGEAHHPWDYSIGS